MLSKIDAALSEVRHSGLVSGDWVRDLLLDLRPEASMLDAVLLLGGVDDLSH